MKTYSVNSNGEEMILVEYISESDVTVLFSDTNTVLKNQSYAQFLNGKIKNPECRTVCGVGYHGIGNYTPFKDGKRSVQYQCWIDMIKRVYSGRTHYNRYENCTVCTEWFNFQNFAKWYDENYYTIKDERMELDKDILYKNNRIYSPDTCIFVPRPINILFTKNDKYRGEYPIGMSKCGNRFKVRCAGKYLGLFVDIDSAFLAYKAEKERVIKEVADKYKKYIPIKLYDALYRYEVEIDD